MEQSRSHIPCAKTMLPGGVNPGSRGLLTKLGLPAIFALVPVCGCKCDQEDDAMANSYYLSPHKDLRRLGCVALVEMDSTSSYPEIAALATDTLFLETQKRQVFGVMIVHRDDPAWHSLQENLDSLQALQRLVTIREALNCNGLLVGTVTRYDPTSTWLSACV